MERKETIRTLSSPSCRTARSRCRCTENMGTGLRWAKSREYALRLGRDFLGDDSVGFAVDDLGGDGLATPEEDVVVSVTA